MARHHHQLSTTQRGLGWEHQRLRARLLPHAYGTPCPLCGRAMLKGQDLDLDHATPRALGGGLAGARIVHRHCNRSHGARLGNQLRTRTRRSRRASSRRW